MGTDVLRPLILGLLLGLAVLLAATVKHWAVKQPSPRVKAHAHSAEALYDASPWWCHIQVDGNDWLATPANTLRLRELVSTSDKELVLPVFPTVYKPNNVDRLYYQSLLESGIACGDKVLVVGTGSGCDAWVAWLKSQSLVYVIDINPMAIANTRATARLGGFQVRALLGDICDVDLPEDFRDFDFVLWNMPFLKAGDYADNFHDGDDGSILTSFLALMPSLLKENGQAIILNNAAAAEFIRLPYVAKRDEGKSVAYIIQK
jgi:SAM-dependent methyltransferase